MRRPLPVTHDLATVALSLALALAAVPALGAEFRSGEQVVVAAGEVVDDDLYASGDRVLIEGTVTGDLVATGREVRVRGEIGGDLIAAAQAVVVEGRVGDDVRVAGLGLFLKKGADVGDDLFAAGFALQTDRGSRVGGSVFQRSQIARLGGAVDGALIGGGTAVEINGSVAGTVRMTMAAGGDPGPWLAMIPTPEPLPTVPGGLTLGSDAALGEDLLYTSIDEAAIDPAATVAGRTERSEPEVDGEGTEPAEPAWRKSVRRLAALLLVGLLLAGLASRRLRRWAAQPDRRLGTVLLLGLVTLPVLAAGSLLLFVFGLLLGIAAGTSGFALLAFALAGGGVLTLLLGAFLSWLGAVLVGPVVAGTWLGSKLLAASGREARPWLGMVLGVCVLALLGLVPWLGMIVAVAATIVGVGAIAAGWRQVAETEPLAD